MVLVDSSHEKVKFDKDDPQLDSKRRLKRDDSSFFETLAQPVASMPASSAGSTSATGGSPRLAQLAALKEQGLISDEQYAELTRLIGG